MAAKSSVRWEDLEIEKAVPVPTPTSSSLAVLGRMEVDDSFAVPKKFRNTLISAVIRYRTKIDKTKRFTVRVTDNDSVRCWRIK